MSRSACAELERRRWLAWGRPAGCTAWQSTCASPLASASAPLRLASELESEVVATIRPHRPEVAAGAMSEPGSEVVAMIRLRRPESVAAGAMSEPEPGRRSPWST